MNKTISEACDYITRLHAAPIPDGVQAFVLPPLTALASVRSCLPPQSPILLGAQNAHWAPEGAGNAAGLLREPHVDGPFVGRAGWTVSGFQDLLALAAIHAEATRA